MLTVNPRRSAIVILLAVTAWLASGVPDATAVRAPGAEALWMAPTPDLIRSRAALAGAVRDFSAGQPSEALPVFNAAARDVWLGPYAQLYAARAYLVQDRATEATRLVDSILAAGPSDALAEAALRVAVDAASSRRDVAGVLTAARALAARPNSAPVAATFGLLQAAIAASDRVTAIAAFRTLYFDHPASQEAADAIEEMEKIGIQKPVPARADLATHLARAERLFAAGRYTDARATYAASQPVASGGDRDLADLRIAECDLFLKKYAAAATALRAHAAKSTARADEAEYHHLTAVRGLGKTEEYVSLVRAFVDGPTDPVWAERALNELGTHYILNDEDEKAAEVFAEQYARFPLGRFADRAAWRAGWWAYKQKAFAETVRIFESAAVAMRRADYRPAWLYWAARAHQELGHRDVALDGFRRVIADYRNSYYGRTAVKEAEQILSTMRPAGAGPVSPARVTWPATIAPSPRPANGTLIEHLLAAGMYEEALLELRRLQATGQASPLVDATVAFALNRQGKLRPAITAMRRAYPQFMAEGGEALPGEILAVIFPMDHWDLLRAHASARRLDPFLVAALVAQESTFQADIKSVANAWGLMQILPATGRRYANSLGIRPFSTFRLVEPEVNVRIGTSYFADLLRRFGDVAPALAAYNAGENRVERWLAERPGLDRDEFIDDIPFPETQNYVKRILGTAEDYRILYGGARR